MPIYEYSCKKCKSHLEVMQKISDKPLTRCKKCGGKLEKEWSPTSFQFKGAGWYVTDYARKGSDKSDKKGSKSDSTTSTTNDAKPTASEKSTSNTAAAGD
jgi:putative FmdB family regulatory protein